jgi:hypothetical protein
MRVFSLASLPAECRLQEFSKSKNQWNYTAGFCQNIKLAKHQKKEFTDHEKHSNTKMNRSGQIPLSLKKERAQPRWQNAPIFLAIFIKNLT